MSNISIILYEIFLTAQSYALGNVPNKDFGAVLLHAAIKNRRQNLPSVVSFVARPPAGSALTGPAAYVCQPSFAELTLIPGPMVDATVQLLIY